MALLTVCFWRFFVGADPAGADRMHTVRSAGNRCGHSCVASRTFGYDADMVLEVGAVDIVVGLSTGKFCVCGAVARGTRQTAVAR